MFVHMFEIMLLCFHLFYKYIPSVQHVSSWRTLVTIEFIASHV